VAAILLASTAYRGAEGRVVRAERSFFGVHRVALDPSGRYHALFHGTTLHGMQSLEAVRRREPLTYFHPSGPLGQLFGALRPARAVGVVGLGAGSLACYARPGQAWTFYEIDPVVLRLARDIRYFTFLADCLPDTPVVLGDARLSLAREAGPRYDLLVLDAYSSDAPPLHLLTREAFGVYLDRLAPGGLLVFNVSNRHFDLEPVVGTQARALGLAGLVRDDAEVEPAAWDLGKRPSQWVVLARDPARLAALARDGRWAPPRVAADARPWTDDFASLLPTLRLTLRRL
jgi:hypothetical protein